MMHRTYLFLGSVGYYINTCFYVPSAASVCASKLSADKMLLVQDQLLTHFRVRSWYEQKGSENLVGHSRSIENSARREENKRKEMRMRKLLLI